MCGALPQELQAGEQEGTRRRSCHVERGRSELLMTIYSTEYCTVEKTSRREESERESLPPRADASLKIKELRLN